jgi:hypothetical protein
MGAFGRVVSKWLEWMPRPDRSTRPRASSALLAGACLLLLGLGPLGSGAAWADVCTESEINDLLNRFERAVESGRLEAVTTLSLWATIDPSRNRAWKSYFETGKPKHCRFVDREIASGGAKVLGKRVDVFDNDESLEVPNLVYALRRVGDACRLDDRGV